MKCFFRDCLGSAVPLVLAIVAFSTPIAAFADDGHKALVIGNQNYDNMDSLHTSVSDAKAFATQLSSRHFDVIEGYNLRHSDMQILIRKFISAIRPGAIAIFYFSGHGVEIDGKDLLLPKDTISNSPADYVRAGIDTATFVDELRKANPPASRGFNFLIIDACRDNPFAGIITQSDRERKLGITYNVGALGPFAASGMFIIYASDKGQRSLDTLVEHDPNPNGLFMRMFLQESRSPGLSISQLVERTQQRIAYEASSVGMKQNPVVRDDSVGNFIFTPYIRRDDGSFSSPWLMSNSGCFIYGGTSLSATLESWTGNCDPNGFATGYGTVTLRLGGVWSSETGSYVGGFPQSGSRHLLINSLGLRLDGMIKNGFFDGEVIASYPNGGRYRGAWRNSLPNGYGTFELGSSRWTGLWVDGCFAKGTDHAAAVGRELASCTPYH